MVSEMKVYACVRKGKKNRCDDRVLVGDYLLEDGYYEAEIEESDLLVAVCDGVGGHAGGDRAATMTLQALADAVAQGKVSKEELLAQIKGANEEIRAASDAAEQYRGMASTLSLLSIKAEGSELFHLGDSRIYQCSKAQGYQYLTPITEDQNRLKVWKEMEEYKRGNISEETLKTDPSWCYIISYMGMAPEELEKRIVVKGDIPWKDGFLLTSDGVHDYLEEDELEALFFSPLSKREVIQLLMDCAVKNGSKDDQSVIIVESTKKEEL